MQSSLVFFCPFAFLHCYPPLGRETSFLVFACLYIHCSFSAIGYIADDVFTLCRVVVDVVLGSILYDFIWQTSKANLIGLRISEIPFWQHFPLK